MSARAWSAFAIVSVLWGVPYLFIKVAVDDGVPPATIALARVVLGGAVLLLLARRAGVLDSLRGRFKWLAAFAVVEFVIPWPLIGVGEQHVASSLAAIIIAAAPLFVAVLALRFDASERPDRKRLIGLIVGLFGVAALVGVDVAGNSSELLGALAILVSAFCYAVGPMVVKRHLADLDPRASMGGSLALAAVLLVPIALADPPSSGPSLAAAGSVVALGLFCTAAALAFYGLLIAEVGAGRALVITYINPVVAVGLGVAILGERPGPGAIAGLLLILAGSWLSTDGRLPPSLAAAVGRLRWGGARGGAAPEGATVDPASARP